MYSLITSHCCLVKAKTLLSQSPSIHHHLFIVQTYSKWEGSWLNIDVILDELTSIQIEWLSLE